MIHRKWLLLLSPGIFFFGCCGWNVWQSYGKILQAQEAQAAITVPVADFAESYREGQRWVQFEGKLAVAQHRAQPLQSRSHEPLVGIVVPLVPPDWGPTDLVHVLVHCATVKPENVQRTLDELKARPLRTVSNEPIPRPIDAVRAEFPSLNFVEPIIEVVGTDNEHAKPDVFSTASWFFVLLAVFLVWLVFLARQVRREFSASGEAQGERTTDAPTSDTGNG